MNVYSAIIFCANPAYKCFEPYNGKNRVCEDSEAVEQSPQLVDQDHTNEKIYAFNARLYKRI